MLLSIHGLEDCIDLRVCFEPFRLIGPLKPLCPAKSSTELKRVRQNPDCVQSLREQDPLPIRSVSVLNETSRRKIEKHTANPCHAPTNTEYGGPYEKPRVHPAAFWNGPYTPEPWTFTPSSKMIQCNSYRQSSRCNHSEGGIKGAMEGEKQERQNPRCLAQIGKSQCKGKLEGCCKVCGDASRSMG